MAFIQKGGKALGLLRTVETVQNTMIKIKKISSDIKSQIANMTKFKADVAAINSEILQIRLSIFMTFASYLANSRIESPSKSTCY